MPRDVGPEEPGEWLGAGVGGEEVVELKVGDCCFETAFLGKGGW